jgi:hypothetical protein
VTKRISPSVVTIICGRVVGPQDQRTLAPGEGYLGLYCSMTIRASTTRRNAARRLPSLTTARRQSGIGHAEATGRLGLHSKAACGWQRTVSDIGRQTSRAGPCSPFPQNRRGSRRSADCYHGNLYPDGGKLTCPTVP